jgi:hypothetical protein
MTIVLPVLFLPPNPGLISLHNGNERKMQERGWMVFFGGAG